jgi:indolepyruvate ferredoxin oxidoreductase
MMTAFKTGEVQKARRRIDMFSKTEERRHERQLIEDYVMQLDEIMAKLNAGNHAIAVQLASVPDEIRGYGHVKERNIKSAKALEEQLLRAFRSPQPVRQVA